MNRPALDTQPKRAAIMQPTFLPWCGYFALMASVDLFVFLDDVQFDKRSWQQRNRIKTPQGVIWLTVPVLTKGRRDQTISEAEIQPEAKFPDAMWRTIEMNFLPDVYVECETCMGRRYNRETLEILYKSKSISNVLEMPVSEATEFFQHIPKIYRKLKTLNDVGLGYITLGQQATTLSGGEAQRVKLAEELSKRDTGNTVYILDEPTTGLHFEDIRYLLKVLNTTKTISVCLPVQRPFFRIVVDE